MSLIRNIHKDGAPFTMGDTTSRVLIAPEVGARHVTFNYIRYAPHAEFPQHIHDRSEDVFLVLEGQGWLKEGEKLTPIGPGDVIFVPPGERHGTVAGPEGMVVVSCQGPPDPKLYTGERDSFRQAKPDATQGVKGSGCPTPDGSTASSGRQVAKFPVQIAADRRL